MLVTVDRGETRVAMLEAAGDPTPVAPPTANKRGGSAAAKRGGGGQLPPGYRVAEVYFERRGGRSIVGNIYKGRVDNVLPGLEAAFVDIGLEKNGFLHVDEIVLPGVETGRRGRGKTGSPRITDLLSPGQEIVVQVVKDPLKTKGARLSMELTIAGRYMVYAPTGEGVGVSRRLEDAERDRLRKEAKQLDLGGGGAIIRTAAYGAKRVDFERELLYLFKLNEVLHKRVEEAEAPALVFQEADLSVRVVRDIFSEHFERAIVDDPHQHRRLVSFFTRTAPELVDRVELWEADEPLFEAYGVDPVIEGMLSRRVDLPSGGYLMIDYAEALTVIDINTGSFTGKGKAARLEDTITKTNLEAAEEVVRQLRLRDIGGIIVIDFIDMARSRNREAVLKVLRGALDEDRTKTFVVEISPLGLVEMTRQNVTDGVREIMTKACPTCDGEGVVKSEETIAIEVERKLRELVKGRRGETPEAFLVRLNPRVTAQFIAENARTLHALESELGVSFHFEGSEGLPLDHFAVTREGSREEIMAEAVPFRPDDEVHVEIVEPHMYNVDDAVAKVDGYIISVVNGGAFVGEKKLVRIEDAGRTAAVAVLVGEDAEAAAAAAEERAREREQAEQRAKRSAAAKRGAARRKARQDEAAAAEPAAAAASADAAGDDDAEGRGDGDSGPSSRRRRGRGRGRKRDADGGGEGAGREVTDAETAEAVETLADGAAATAGTGPAALEDADGSASAPETPKPRRRRRRGGGGKGADSASDNGRAGGSADGEPEGAEAAVPDTSTDAAKGSGARQEGDDDALSSPSRRRGRRGGRRRSRASAPGDRAEATDAGE